MLTTQPPVRTQSQPAVLLRVFLASTIANVPMLCLLLVPQLMRSRAGSETLLMLGTTLYLALIVASLVTTPRLTAWVAPRGEAWSPSTASVAVHAIRRSRPLAFWQRLGEWCILFVVGQAAGFAVAELFPYIEGNPRFGVTDQPRWLLHYGNYVLQAVTVYLFSCLSFAWLGTRLRVIALQPWRPAA
jgi:hypothetical protein